MKRLSLLLSLLLVVALLAGCAASTMKVEKTLVDGSVIKYTVKINSVFQDLKGSDIAATLDPEGKTKVKVGAMDTTISPVGADVAASMVELVKIMLPYMMVTPVPVAP